MDKQVKHELQIQQLVDGGLGHSERSKLLLSLENDSPVWRDIALAFVQNQILDETLGLGPVTSPETAQKKETSAVNIAPSRGWTLLAIAASLLLGLWLGSFFGDSTTPIAMNPDPTRQEVKSDPPELNNDHDQIMLAEALARSVRPVSLDARRAFLKAGYVLDEQEKIADVQLPTGDLIQLPIRQFNVRYLGNAAYQ